MEYRKLTEQYDKAIAEIIRSNLEKHDLNIPGTVYFDEELDHLSVFYDNSGRAYDVLIENGMVIGGIGYAEFDGFENCCEMQKLYLIESAKGRGIGYDLIYHMEEEAKTAGYGRVYLETHTRLEAAIHLYEKCGYREIERPESVIHSTMNRFFLKELCD